MNEDKFLKDLLTDYHPQLSDDRQFMEKLQRQMELVEEVKAYQRAETRKNRQLSVWMLAVGIVVPAIVETYVNGTESEFILLLLHNVQYIGLAVGAAFVTLSLLFTMRIASMKQPETSC